MLIFLYSCMKKVGFPTMMPLERRIPAINMTLVVEEDPFVRLFSVNTGFHANEW